jgi:bleomycin hydrolase
MKKIFYSILITFFYVFAFAQEHPDYEIINQVKTTPVKDQGMTGTCWSFATVSFIETEYLRKTDKEIDLSEMYIVYNAYLEKAKYYVKLHGLGNFSQGGQAHDVLNIAENYGFIPQNEFNGYLSGQTTYNHSILEKTLKNYLDSIIKITPIPENWLDGVYKNLNSSIGQIPENFQFDNQSYTAQSFTSDELKFNFDDYVELTSYNHHDFYTRFDLEVPDNWSHDEYYNVPLDDLMAIIDSALNTGYSVCWDGDVSEKKFNHKKGNAELSDEEILLINENGIQETRQKTFENQTTTDDHLMHLTGIAKNKNGVIYYQTKNSWNSDSNKFGGFLYMSKDFVQIKTIAILVHKDVIPEEIAKKIGLN